MPRKAGSIALAAWGTTDATARAAGATIVKACGIKLAKAGNAKAPTGSPKPLYTIRAGTISVPA